LRDRQAIWANRRKLKGSNIYIKEDLPYEIEDKIKELTPIMHAARQQDMKASISRDVLRINGEKFKVNNLHNLPKSIQPSQISVKTTQTEHFFWGKAAPFSNFNTEYQFRVDGKIFSSGEQFFNYSKAKFFEDQMAMEKILTENDPAKQKKIRIQGYNKEKWEKVQVDYMKEGVMQRFSQNEKLLESLKNTGDRMICEASLYDRIWGIGKRLTDDSLRDRGSWGENRLGRILTRVREMLCKE
jgi:ribA/ribD-fused uncharacterized protein